MKYLYVFYLSCYKSTLKTRFHLPLIFQENYSFEKFTKVSIFIYFTNILHQFFLTAVVLTPLNVSRIHLSHFYKNSLWKIIWLAERIKISLDWPSFVLNMKYFKNIIGGENVCSTGDDFCCMLASLPTVFSVILLSTFSNQSSVCQVSYHCYPTTYLQ